jgi:hypothetical protein
MWPLSIKLKTRVAVVSVNVQSSFSSISFSNYRSAGPASTEGEAVQSLVGISLCAQSRILLKPNGRESSAGSTIAGLKSVVR